MVWLAAKGRAKQNPVWALYKIVGKREEVDVESSTDSEEEGVGQRGRSAPRRRLVGVLFSYRDNLQANSLSREGVSARRAGRELRMQA
jgi:hypothetical protein